MTKTLSRSLAVILAVILCFCVAACAVPFAPGYHIAKQADRIRFVPGDPPAVAIRAEYMLMNAGTSDLNFVDVRLPSTGGFGRSDLRAQVDGRDVTPTALSAAEAQADPDVVRIAFAKPWTHKQKLEVTLAYTLRSPADSDYGVTIEPTGFHLGARGWAPRLLPPRYELSTYPSQPSRVDYTVRVPADFVVVAGGEKKKQKNAGGEIEYAYELRASNFGPFVVAGRYAKWPGNGAKLRAEFLTTQPLTGDPAQAAQQVAEIWQTLNSDFGVLDKQIRVPAIAESSAIDLNLQGIAGPAAESFPGGALVNPAALALGISSNRFLQIVSEAMARAWFDGAVLPSAGAEIGIGDGAPEYASIVTDEARNGPLARRQRIYEYLRRYDDLVKYSDETPIAATTFASPLAQRRIALAKAPLFYIELEDACGEAPVRAGLAHMLSSMRGQEVDYGVLRAVLEESTGRDLAKIFRQWLQQKGIPENFRARYPYGEGSQEIGD
jgi:hypothetical protein